MQNKYWIGVGAAALVIFVLAGGLIYWTISKNNEKVSFGAASIHETSTQQQSSKANNQSTPMQSQTNLGVSSTGPARNLGQISQSGSLTASPLGGSNPAQSNSSSKSSQTIDPSTFGAYEKYKNENQALFGDIVVGTGATLGNGQTATVVYKGWLTNGQMFDQSRAGADGKIQAFQFKVGSGQVIPGWDQGLVGMKIGGARLVIVPPSVGYGAAGKGSIPANSVLVFQVQLVNVE